MQVIERAVREIEEVDHPWQQPQDIDVMFNHIGDAKYVLLGEASHGTSEYYYWRSLISQRLIVEKGFSFIAVEGDWPDCYRITRYIKHYPEAGMNATEVLCSFRRWPTWMWANREIVPLIEWLHQHNADLPLDERVGFYGLDVYSLWESMNIVLEYLAQADPSAADKVREAYRCFEPYQGDPQQYAYNIAFTPQSCEEAVIKAHQIVQERFPLYAADYDAALDALQNARIVVNGERYYRAMVRNDVASWNVRDHHMAETLGNLMNRYGEDAKAIIWAHNTHVGDARYTDMVDDGLINIGQLVREEQTEDNTFIVGFGSYSGSVIAGRAWDAPARIMQVPPAHEDSWDAIMHEAHPGNKLILSYETGEYEALWHTHDQRAIGVVYHPDRERAGNYVPTILPRRYDAFIYIDQTEALHPLHQDTHAREDVPETYPWAV